MKRFAAFAIFALFYHFAAVDSILGLGGHHVDTKVDTKTITATTSSIFKFLPSSCTSTSNAHLNMQKNGLRRFRTLL